MYYVPCLTSGGMLCQTALLLVLKNCQGALAERKTTPLIQRFFFSKVFSYVFVGQLIFHK